jgi:hypothetical protein
MTGGANYISWRGHGGIDLGQPFDFTDITSYGFILDASRSAMQALVDELLGPATQGKVKYTVVGSAALVTFFNAARCVSDVDVVGFLPSRECAVWAPLLETWPGGEFPDRLVLWTPYIFIDNDIGLASGREIWGWPKALASIVVATDAPQAPARFACTPTIIRTFGPNQPAEKTLLLSVEGTRPIGAIPSGAAGLLEVLFALFGDLAALFAEVFLIHPVLPAIALKQVRDSADATKACFQAIINSPCRLTTIRSAALLMDNFTLSVTTCASHPIMADVFGIAPQAGATTLPVRLAGAMGFDMAVETGSVIVSSS